MIIIHATRKLLARLKTIPRATADVDGGLLGPWSADIRIVDRKHYVIARHEASSAAVIIPWMSFKANPAASIAEAFRPVMQNIGVPDNVINTAVAPFDGTVFTKTASRAAVNSLQSVVGTAGFLLHDGYAPNEVALRLVDFIATAATRPGTSNGATPYERIGELLGVKTKAARQLTIPFQEPSRTPTVALRISLDGIRPEIWRTVVVPKSITLSQLHNVIQVAMGWENSHLHLFAFNKQLYGSIRDFDDLQGLKEERSVTLETMGLKHGSRFTYTYDMGDHWQHVIQVVGVDEVASEASLRLLDGANACPPEDVGGTFGYANFVLAMMEPRHEEHDGMMEWYGEPFDHTAFDGDATQRRLQSVLQPRRGSLC